MATPTASGAGDRARITIKASDFIKPSRVFARGWTHMVYFPENLFVPRQKCPIGHF
jgi:hypothetical protein